MVYGDANAVLGLMIQAVRGLGAKAAASVPHTGEEKEAFLF